MGALWPFFGAKNKQYLTVAKRHQSNLSIYRGPDTFKEILSTKEKEKKLFLCLTPVND
jgi:hypothetical protein